MADANARAFTVFHFSSARFHANDMAGETLQMFRFIVKSQSTLQTREFQRQLFSPDIKALLSQFVDCAYALNDTAFVQNSEKTKISIHLGNDGKITDLSVLPPDEAICAFLH